MKAQKLGSAPADVRAEWRRLNDAIEDIEKLYTWDSSHPQLIRVTPTEGGMLLDCSGLVDMLRQKSVTDLAVN